MGDTDGAESRDKTSKTKIEDWDNRKCRTGNPAIHALVEAIDGIVGSNSIGEVQKGLVNRGAIAVIPAPTYGYMRKDEFYTGPLEDNLLNEWVPCALRGMIYTDKVGRCMSADTFFPDTVGMCRGDLRMSLAYEIHEGSRV